MKREVIERLWKQAEEKRELHRDKFYFRQEECRLECEGKAPVIRFRALDGFPGVNVGFSTRFGGVSVGEQRELNLGFGRGDDPQAVQRNYQIFCESLGVVTEDLVLSDQVHGTDIACVSKEDTCGEGFARVSKEDTCGEGSACVSKEDTCGEGSACVSKEDTCGEGSVSDFKKDTREGDFSYASEEGACGGDSKNNICRVEKRLTAVDGLLTEERGVCLVTAYADCVPLFFYDPVRGCIASSHSGWRGTAAGMGRKTVEEMERRFGSRREDVLAVVGPSICQNCYEVSGDVMDGMKNTFSAEEMEKIASANREKPGKYQLDLWAANALLLQKCGLKPEHIHVSGMCTCCNPELFFSHRASGGQRGNLCGFMMLV